MYAQHGTGQPNTGKVKACHARFASTRSSDICVPPQAGFCSVPPSIADLHVLDASCNMFTRLPGAITAATALISLVLIGNDGLMLCKEDAAVLRALPRLQRVHIFDLPPPDPTLVEEMQCASPHLRIY